MKTTLSIILVFLFTHPLSAQDTTPPDIRNVFAASNNWLRVIFSEPVQENEATNLASYTFSHGIVPLSAQMLSDTQTVCIALNKELNQGDLYTAIISNIQDLAGNTISNGSSFAFNYFTPPKKGLAVWYRADQGFDSPSPASATWHDQSGKGVDAVKYLVGVPIWNPHAANGMPAIQFTSNRRMDFTLNIKGLKDITLLTASSHLPSDGDTNAFICPVLGWHHATSSSGGVWLRPHQENISAQFDLGDDPAYTSSVYRFSYNRPASISTNWSVSMASKADSNETIAVNGHTVAVQTRTGPQAVHNDVQNTGHIGYDSYATYTPCFIGDILIYTGALTSAEQEQATYYLMAKYLGKPRPPLITLVHPSQSYAGVTGQTSTITVTGTCPSHAAGLVAWTNSRTAESGVFPVSSTWTETISLDPGYNLITFITTNATGQSAGPVTVSIFRPEPTATDYSTWAADHGIGSDPRTNDFDGDGFSNEEEYISDTDPDSPSSSFTPDISSMARHANGHIDFNTFTGTTNSRRYDVYMSTNLLTGRWIPRRLNRTGAVDSASLMLSITNFYSDDVFFSLGTTLPEQEPRFKFLTDFVHHNPGEPRFDSAFVNPRFAQEYGYRGQAFRHLNTIVRFDELGTNYFPEPDAQTWLTNMTDTIEKEIRWADLNGMEIYYQLDLFVLPSNLVNAFKSDICLPNGDISVDRQATLDLHSMMFDEMFERYPQVDGLIIRVGETYLNDTPYHVGNGAVDYGSSPGQAEKDQFVTLLNFLREEICVKHNRWLLFRTWDTLPNRFHADKEYYLEVTDQIAPHPKLMFSIKHTALDFWRHVKFNEAIGKGNHQQIVEVQCQREYEAKGACPNYIMHYVITGFPENSIQTGLEDFRYHPNVRGIYGWSRGGGWYGPYLTNETWCALHAYVLAQWAQNPERSEEDIFNEYCRTYLGIEEADISTFRQLALLSGQAMLKGRYCTPYDITLNESFMPTKLWLRDDRLGGMNQLHRLFGYLYTNSLTSVALQEKSEAVALWNQMSNLFSQITFSNAQLQAELHTSIEYGRRLFTIIDEGWKIMAKGYEYDKTGSCDTTALGNAITAYDNAWISYRALTNLPGAASLFLGEYLSLPGEPASDGLDETVDRYRPLVP